jgi:hypothetical protein
MNYWKKLKKKLEKKKAKGDVTAMINLEILMEMPVEEREPHAKRHFEREIQRRKQKRLNFLDAHNLPTIPLYEEELEGLQAIADYLGLTLDQIKYRSGELQEAGLLREKIKGKGRKRQEVLVGYGSELKAYLYIYPRPRLEMLRKQTKMQRKRTKK